MKTSLAVFSALLALCMNSFAEHHPLDDYQAAKGISGYPHSIFMALYTARDPSRPLRLYYSTKSRGTSRSDVRSVVDLDPSPFTKTVKGVLDSFDIDLIEVTDQTLADYIVATKATSLLAIANDRLTPVDAEKYFTFRRDLTYDISVIDNKTSAVLGENVFRQGTLTSMGTVRHGESKTILSEWDDHLVEVALYTVNNAEYVTDPSRTASIIDSEKGSSNPEMDLRILRSIGPLFDKRHWFRLTIDELANSKDLGSHKFESINIILASSSVSEGIQLIHINSAPLSAAPDQPRIVADSCLLSLEREEYRRNPVYYLDRLLDYIGKSSPSTTIQW
jgi:hypothetical protein